MTDRSKLLALAEAVEKLTGPERETDARIAHAIKWRWDDWVEGDLCIESYSVEAVIDRVQKNSHNSIWLYLPRFTASLDAAMTLVIKDRDWMVDNFDGPASERRHSATVFHERGKPYDEYSGHGANPALALCAAALRAQAEALA